jgi:vacuolar-type H+-ATPase subunit I/STV1
MNGLDFIDFTQSIPEEEFPFYFPDAETIQRLMDKLESRQSVYLKDVHSFKGGISREQARFVKKKEMVVHLKDTITSLEQMLAGLEVNKFNQQFVEKYTDELKKAKLTLEKVQEQLARRDELDLVPETFEYQMNRMYAAGVDEWVDKLGKWFASGAVGPGMVRFKEKTYRAVLMSE